MSVGECIKLALIEDDTGETAAAVQARNPLVWPDVDDVPDYAFKPLTQIWIGAAATSSDLEKRN